MDPSTSAAAGPAARDEELRGECAKAFALYKKGNLTRGTAHLEKLLALHPAHPLLHFAYLRLAHLLLLEKRQLAGIMKQMSECGYRATAAAEACPHSLLPCLFVAQMCYDTPAPNEHIDSNLGFVRKIAAAAAAASLNAADLEYAKPSRRSTRRC